MATILFTWELGGGTGHIINMRPFVQRLVKRGDAVYVALRDVTSGAALLSDTGARVIQSPMLLGKVRRPVQLARTFAHILHNTGFSTDEQLAALTAAWQHLFAMIKPDLIVFEHSPSALLASCPLQAKRAVIGTGFFSPPDIYPLPDLRPWMPPLTTQLRQDEDIVHDRVCRQLARWGKPPIERLSTLYREVDANFLLTFKELDHYSEREAVIYWGTPQLEAGQAPSWPSGDGPRVFAYLRRSPILGKVLAALRDSRVPTLAYLVDCDPETRARYASETIRIATQRLDIDQVARECDLAILNGNAGTASALLLRGKPMLQLPFHLEQALLSLRVEQLGAGLTCAVDEPDHVAVRLGELLQSDRFATAAERFADRLDEYEEKAAMLEIGERLEHLIESS